MRWRFVLFLFVLSFFYWGNSWYESSSLVIHGRAMDNSPFLRVHWDSGPGFNSYEQRKFRPVVRPLNENYNNILILGAKGERNGASLSKDVVCTAIIIDGVPLDLASLKQNIPFSDRGLHFTSDKTLTLTVQAKSQIGIKFQTNNHSGVAFLSINGITAEHDLYVANVEAKYKQFDYWMLLSDGSFRVEMEMPRYAIHELEILNGNAAHSIQLIKAEIHSKGKVIELLKEPIASLTGISFPTVLEKLRTYFNPFQFLQQICFALLTTWLFSSVIQVYTKIGGLKACFFEEKRQVFWLLFISSCGVFSTWLAAFWPGVMSVDSLKVWRAAMLPDVYLNDHPVLNVFLYKYLYQLWSTPAVVPITQIFFMALLISWFIFWVYQRGVSLIILLPCFLFILLSIPVGVFNLMLWKDVPFALLVVFWACMLVRLYWKRQHGGIHWSRQQVLALLFLGLALGLVRHNGLVFLLVLPVIFVFLRLVPLKRLLIVFLISGLTGGACYAVLKNMNMVPETEFLVKQINHYAGGVSAKNVINNSREMVSNYMTILDFTHRSQKWDKFHYYFNDRYAYWFLLHSGWWDLYPYKKMTVPFPWLKEKALKIYKKSYSKPWDWFSWNPVWLLALLPLVTLLFFWFPYSAVFGIVLLSGVLPLIYLRIYNWRYYYFLYLGLLLMLPVIMLDLSYKKKSRMTE